MSEHPQTQQDHFNPGEVVFITDVGCTRRSMLPGATGGVKHRIRSGEEILYVVSLEHGEGEYCFSIDELSRERQHPLQAPEQSGTTEKSLEQIAYEAMQTASQGLGDSRGPEWLTLSDGAKRGWKSIVEAVLAADPVRLQAAKIIRHLLEEKESYEKRLVGFGDPEHLVYSKVNEDGKEIMLSVAQAIDGGKDNESNVRQELGAADPVRREALELIRLLMDPDSGIEGNIEMAIGINLRAESLLAKVKGEKK